jgi:hypothetical protein
VGSSRIQLSPDGPWVSVPTLFGRPAGEEFRVIMSVSESGFEGFTNHEVTFSGRSYDLNKDVPADGPLLLGSARVGDGVESEGRTINLGGGVIFSAPECHLC